MATLLRLLFLIPVALIGVGFALANRHLVTLDFDPFKPDEPTVVAFAAPLYLVVFVSIIFGVVLGGFASWLAQGRHRRAARYARNEASRLRDELESASRNTSNQNPIATIKAGYGAS